MAKKQKFYVVWNGDAPGIYTQWEECKKYVEGASKIKYKSFPTLEEAESAFFDENYDINKPSTTSNQNIIQDSICVDAACSGNPGILEYQGVNTSTKEILFRQGPFKNGTNNIGEFLAIVHALAYLEQKKNTQTAIYTDSVTALAWVRNKKAKTLLEITDENKKLFDLIQRAETWLRSHQYSNKILKWETKVWGEIPADFNRKK